MSCPSIPIAKSRREARRQDRRDAIMDVAAQSFLLHGYAGTTMSGIAATLGGSKGTLWNHFPSKEGLFEAVMDRATAVYRAQLTEILHSPEENLPSTLLRVGRAFLTKVTSPEAIALHRLVVAETRRFSEVGRIFYERAPRQTRAILADFLGDAMARGQLRQADPEAAARVLMMLCMAGSHQKLVVGILDCADAALIEIDAAFAVEIFLRAYAPDSSSS